MANSYEKLSKLFTQAPVISYADTVIGEIVTPPPQEPCIKIMGFLIKENLFFAEHLLEGYKREVDIEDLELETEKIEMNLSKIDILTTGCQAEINSVPPHSHLILSVKGVSGSIEGIKCKQSKGKGKCKITYSTEPLKAKDKIIVQIDNENKFFYIIDKFKLFT